MTAHHAEFRRRMRRGLQVAALVALAWLGAAVQPALAACQLPRLEIPVRIVNHRPVGVLTLNGTEVLMLIDSGAFFSMLQPSTATQLGLRLRSLPEHIRIYGHTGAIQARLTKVEKVGLLGSTLSNIEFIVGGNELGSGIGGILGRNFLSMADTEYDLAHGVVRLAFPKGDCADTNLAYWAGDAPVIETELLNSHLQGNTDIRVAVRVNDVKLKAMLDSGAPRTVLQLGAAHRAGIRESELGTPGRAGGAGAGRVNSWSAVIGSFELGGEKITNNRMSVDDTDYGDTDMLLGLDYFLSHRIYVSRLQRKVYATWNGGPVFARGAEAGEYDTRYAARPQDVPEDDPEALARRGEAHAARGEYAAALKDMDRAVERAPQSAANLLARARVHLPMGQPAKARQDLDEALRLQPALHEARSLRATLRAAQRDRAGAESDLVTLDQLLAPSSHLREAMAQVYVRLGRLPEALKQWELWESTHERDAHLGTVLNERCWLRTTRNLDLKLALEDCKRAVSMERGNSAYRDSLGWTQLRLGDDAEALKAFDAAIETQPRAFSFYGRAVVQQRRGQAQAARRDVDEARRLQPDIDVAVRRAGLPLVEGVLAPPPAAAPGAASAPASAPAS